MGNTSSVGNVHRLGLMAALAFARRPEGVTAPELAHLFQWSARRTQDFLKLLADQKVLAAYAPRRKGAKKGDWRTKYTLAPGVTVNVDLDPETFRALLAHDGLVLDGDAVEVRT